MINTSRVASRLLDDPDFNLQIWTSGDFRGFRANAVVKELWTFKWLREIGAGLLFDVGACVGSYSLMAAARGAKVVAIEPIPINFAECQANIALNELSVTCLQCAAGAENGSVEFFSSSIPGYGQASPVLRYTHQTEQIIVPVRTLDDIALEYGYPTHVKIDVEGSEVDVFRGASKVLDVVQSVICEIRNQEHETDVCLIAEAHGLESVWIGGRRTEDERTHIFRRKHA